MTKDSETPPPPPPPSQEFHPALSVTNIKNAIPLILDRETVQYSNWVELFEVHCHAYNVLDHIDSTVPRPSTISDSLWLRLDSIVKQWIHGTITTDLLQSIMCRGDSAQKLWNKLKDFFQDNKNTRAVYLENQFNSLHLSNFSDINAYCWQLKLLKDQLAAVDQPVTEQKLVIRLVSGLVNTDYDTVATIIQQTDPLPSFETARSRLLLEETRRSNDQGSQPASSVAQMTTNNTTNAAPAPASSQPQQQRSGAPPAGRGGGRGRGRGGPGKGKGRGRGRDNGQQQQASNQPIQWANPPPWAQQQPQQWAAAPYPYPQQAQVQQRPTNQAPRAALVAQHPQQYYSAQYPVTQPPVYGPPMTPTELGNSFATMSLPQDNSWYVDSGATSHMTNNSGSSYGENNNEMQ